MVSYGLAGGAWTEIPEELARERQVALERLQPTPELIRAATERALAEAAAGRLRPLIGGRHPLDRAAEAHAAMEGRAVIGKTLLEVG